MKQVEIFYGDIGTVRNELNKHMEEVTEILSLTQSVSTTGHNTSPMLTVILVYTTPSKNPVYYDPNAPKLPKIKSNEDYIS
jgi:hypothetical protein